MSTMEGFFFLRLWLPWILTSLTEQSTDWPHLQLQSGPSPRTMRLSGRELSNWIVGSGTWFGGGERAGTTQQCWIFKVCGDDFHGMQFKLRVLRNFIIIKCRKSSSDFSSQSLEIPVNGTQLFLLGC